jgi:small-conductance mechanosensitive channel
MAVGSLTGRPARLLGLNALLLLAALWALHWLVSGQAPAEVRHQTWLSLVVTVTAIVLGIALVRGLVNLLANLSTTYLGAARVRSGRALISAILYVLVAIAIASQAQIDLTGIALSGAVTGVIIGIAAQASISNVVAGFVILFARPFKAGQFVTVRASAFGGAEYSGEVGEIALFYTTLIAGSQEIRVPNNAIVTSVVTIRPQMLDVYVPILLPASQWSHFSSEALSHELESALPPGRQVFAQVDRVEGGQAQIGVRLAAASMQERALLETALLKALARTTAVDRSESDPGGRQ